MTEETGCRSRRRVAFCQHGFVRFDFHGSTKRPGGKLATRPLLSAVRLIGRQPIDDSGEGNEYVTNGML